MIIMVALESRPRGLAVQPRFDDLGLILTPMFYALLMSLLLMLRRACPGLQLPAKVVLSPQTIRVTLMFARSLLSRRRISRPLTVEWEGTLSTLLTLVLYTYPTYRGVYLAPPKA